jgi:signal transduction histidine kinase
MIRPYQVWIAFILCGVIVAAAMGWLTVHALRVDRERSAARAEAELEQRVSLALWRMDTKVAPLIAEEAARPPLYFNSFINLDVPAAKGAASVEQVPSPLLAAPAAGVILNFVCPSFGEWKSPQAPPPELESLAVANGLSAEEVESNRRKLDALAVVCNPQELIAKLPEQPLPVWSDLVGVNPSAAVTEQTAGFPQDVDDNPFGFDEGEANAPPAEESHQQVEQQEMAQQQGGAQQSSGDSDSQAMQQAAVPNSPLAPSQQRAPPQQGESKLRKGVVDFGQRIDRVQSATQQEFAKQRAANYILANSERPPSPVVENASRPVWMGDELLLARRVTDGGETVVQGSWLDWPRLKRELLAETADLLPSADLAPVRQGDEAAPTRTLAGLPVRLVLGDAAAQMASLAAVDAPLQWALGVGWAALALALVAVALLLRGVLALSERRAAFVSSVTHELRTPLTTFRMYAEMLARDMVPSAERRREYLETLRTEAERLTHLVENVLSYARLERGRQPRRTERTTPAALVERLAPRLAERAEQARMELCPSVDEAAAKAPLLTDVGVVEQILFNLVDNAAKYAGRASDRRICVDVARDARTAMFTVRDFGPGFASPRDAARSAPFSKSAQEAAETAPGVGLGLALCRRLARDLGGRLDIVATNADAVGAAVTLRLPIEPR